MSMTLPLQPQCHDGDHGFNERNPGSCNHILVIRRPDGVIVMKHTMSACRRVPEHSQQTRSRWPANTARDEQLPIRRSRSRPFNHKVWSMWSKDAGHAAFRCPSGPLQVQMLTNTRSEPWPCTNSPAALLRAGSRAPNEPDQTKQTGRRPPVLVLASVRL